MDDPHRLPGPGGDHRHRTPTHRHRRGGDVTLTEQLRRLYSVARVQGWDEAAGVVQEHLPNWWITTGSLAQDGRKVAGPYPTRRAALDARTKLERGTETY